MKNRSQLVVQEPIHEPVKRWLITHMVTKLSVIKHNQPWTRLHMIILKFSIESIPAQQRKLPYPFFHILNTVIPFCQQPKALFSQKRWIVQTARKLEMWTEFQIYIYKYKYWLNGPRSIQTQEWCCLEQDFVISSFLFGKYTFQKGKYCWEQKEPTIKDGMNQLQNQQKPDNV